MKTSSELTRLPTVGPENACRSSCCPRVTTTPEHVTIQEGKMVVRLRHDDMERVVDMWKRHRLELARKECDLKTRGNG